MRTADEHIARADLLLVERVAARAVDDRRRVVVLVDHLHRHEALARIGQRDRHRPGIEIEHGRRIQRVAVQADDRLLVDRRRLATVVELAEAPTSLRIPPK